MPTANSQSIRLRSFTSEHALRNAALDTILACAEQSIRDRGEFHLVLAGGNTPLAIYQECRHIQTDWSAWNVYFGDERCLPAEDLSRNSFMASETWLNHVPISSARVFVIPAEDGAVAAAKKYADTLRGVGDFDLVLLGLGEDGHTASLFPDHDWGNQGNSPDTLAVFNAPKPPAERVSLSANRLSKARKVVFLVNGSGKQRALTAWLLGQSIPAGSISPSDGVDVFCEGSLLAPLQV
jgi:6-phosphogluconolactonase